MGSHFDQAKLDSTVENVREGGGGGGEDLKGMGSRDFDPIFGSKKLFDLLIQDKLIGNLK